jgi:2,4'-dihydroxyacetophenone dioxygenase
MRVQIMSAATLPNVPVSFHRAEEDLPFVPYQDGVMFQLLQVDLKVGLWVVRVHAEPGVAFQKHRHTGQVLAFTLSGSWRYLEYPEVNTAGSYLYEPAGAVHTLIVPDSNDGVTDIWFAITGANLDLDSDGNVETVLDAATVLEIYRAQCKAFGHPAPDVIGA